jgi:hypothetical protein
MRHILSLEIPDTLNRCILRIVDTSVYDPNIAATCPLLQVTLPGFIHPVNFSPPQIVPGFNANLTACDLGIQVSDCNTTFYDIPDGIIVVKYSVEPRDFVYVEYNHLRITCASNKIRQIYCELNMGACEPSTTVLEKLNKIRLIQQQLLAAKAYVEDCHDPKKGMELYKYAVSQLAKLSCGNSCKTC